jgi:hypothetical protein
VTSPEQDQSISPGDLVSDSMRRLAEKPDLPLIDRVAFAVVIASGGQIGPQKPTFGDIAEILGDVDATEVRQALYAMRERREATDAA